MPCEEETSQNGEQEKNRSRDGQSPKIILMMIIRMMMIRMMTRVLPGDEDGNDFNFSFILIFLTLSFFYFNVFFLIFLTLSP